MSKVCLTTFVYGSKYQDFIPLFIYSALKAYPDYYIKLFVYGRLKEKIKQQLKMLETLGDFEVLENQFNDLSISSPLEARTVRWILPYESFQNFDYLYVVDIDIFYIKEPIELHEQHIKHMDFLGLPFSNIIRNYSAKAHSLKLIYQRLRDTGPTNFINFVTSGILKSKQLSGLHFIRVNPYFKEVEESRNKLEQLISTKKYRKNILNNDEVFLYEMIRDAGYNISGMGVMSNSLEMLDFKNPCKAEFRPHHGIHLGIFRAKKSALINNPILESSEYKYYIDNFQTMIKDDLYIALLNKSSKSLKALINNLYYYYHIESSSNV